MLTFIEKYLWALVVGVGYIVIFYLILTEPLWK